MVIGALAPGVAASCVLPAAKSAALSQTIVEAAELHVVSRRARIVVRFTADENEIAAQIGNHVASVVGVLATVESYRVTERVTSHWLPV